MRIKNSIISMVYSSKRPFAMISEIYRLSLINGSEYFPIVLKFPSLPLVDDVA